jgi:hypothetical protein
MKHRLIRQIYCGTILVLEVLRDDGSKYDERAVYSFFVSFEIFLFKETNPVSHDWSMPGVFFYEYLQAVRFSSLKAERQFLLMRRTSIVLDIRHIIAQMFGLRKRE